jgi:hypothetical protein
LPLDPTPAPETAPAAAPVDTSGLNKQSAWVSPCAHGIPVHQCGGPACNYCERWHINHRHQWPCGNPRPKAVIEEFVINIFNQHVSEKGA